ncbi:MAG: hypothetical protein DRP01_05015, partial [Archaeoglobales archaeon]
AYILNGTQSSTSKYVGLSSGGQLQTWVAVRVWIVYSDGNSSELTDGNYNVNVTRSSSGYGYQNVTWTCPETDLNTTDAIMVRVYLKVGSGSWTAKAKFITSQGMTQIGGNWTFQLYTKNQQTKNPITNQWTTACYFYWGSSSYNSLIDGVEVGQPPSPPQASVNSPTQNYIADTYETIQFKVYWSSNVDLDWCGFSWNESGTWSNWETVWDNAGVNAKWANITKTLTKKSFGKWVYWKMKCNNTAGNTTETQVYKLFHWEPAVGRQKYIAGETASAARGVYFNGSPWGGKEAIYIVYQNTTTDPWEFQVRAYDFETHTWTSYYKIGNSPDDDTHWSPRINVLPDGRLIITYAYYSSLCFRISTYSAKTTSNLQQIINNWESGHTIAPFWTIQFCYPDMQRFDDRLIVIGRDGVSTSGNYSYFVWTDKSFTKTYPKAYFTADENGTWTKVGSPPYTNELFWRNSYIEISSTGSSIISSGYWTLRKGYNEWKDPTNAVIKVLCNATEGKIKIGKHFAGEPWYYSDWYTVSSDLTWFNWTTPVTWNYTIKILATNATNLRIYKIRVEFNMTGFSPCYPLVWTDRESIYMTPYVQNGILMIAGRERYYGDGENPNKIRDLLFMYSEDEGETWKLVNGTKIEIPVYIDTIKVAYYNQTKITTPFPILNGTRPVLYFFKWDYEQLEDVSYLGVAVYNASLGQSGTFTLYNCTFENGTILTFPKQTASEVYFDVYYKRACFWISHNRKLKKFVVLPTDPRKFRITHVYDVMPVDTEGGRTFSILYSPSDYETVLMLKEIVLGHYGDFSNWQVMSTTMSVGCKFTALKTMKVTAITWYTIPYGLYPDEYVDCQAAIYNSTYHKLAESSVITIWQGGKYKGWSKAVTFPNPVTLTENETYWLVWKVNKDDSIQYVYTGGSTNQTFHIPIGWSDPFPTQLNESDMTFYNRKIKIYGYYGRIHVIGLDTVSPEPSNVGAEKTAEEVKFYAEWSDNWQLETATLYWNASGVFEQNGTVNLTGKTCWSNFTRSIPEVGIIAWYITANDTSGNVGNTSLQILELLKTELVSGWNMFNASSVDVGHSLSEINASLNKDNINWTMLVLEYPNGTQYVFVYGYTLNVNVQVTGTDNILYIYCGEAGIWYHKYD